MSTSPGRETKRSAILLAVLRVIATRGLGAVSIRSVAAEADVSVGRVQHCWRFPDGLTLQVLIGLTGPRPTTAYVRSFRRTGRPEATP